MCPAIFFDFSGLSIIKGYWRDLTWLNPLRIRPIWTVSLMPRRLSKTAFGRLQGSAGLIGDESSI
jgi:hypothetical protein